MKVYDAPNIRNIALVGHGGCGKTSLTTAMLFTAGAVNRLGRVEDGTTVTDFDADEIERKISLQTALAFAEWRKTKINILDAPGYGNFLFEARLALRVADTARRGRRRGVGSRGPDREGLGLRRRVRPAAHGGHQPDGPRAGLLRPDAGVGEDARSDATSFPSPFPSEKRRTSSGVVDIVTGKAVDLRGRRERQGEPRRRPRGAQGEDPGVARPARRSRGRERRRPHGEVPRGGRSRQRMSSSAA